MVVASSDYFRKVIGINVMQFAVLIFYILVGKRVGGIVPINLDSVGAVIYSNPLPHVLMLTAIVVGFSTTCVALCIVSRIESRI
jgi:multicomponent Na+:H+ antiporter subunit C